MILVSIVIPTYNRAHVLPRAIDSIINQTYSHWELLVVDDGSTDGTEELMAEYMKKDSRIKFFRRPEGRLRGGNACRNIGVEHAVGEYVAYLDSDDYWKATRLQRCVGFIEKERPDCFYSGMTFYNHLSFKRSNSRAIDPTESAFDFLISRTSTAQTSTIVTKISISKIIDWDETLQQHQDWDFFIRVSKHFQWVYFENYCVIHVWKRGVRRNIHIPSCLKVYNKYNREIANVLDHQYYLRLMLEYCSKSLTTLQYVKIYKKLLRTTNYEFNIRDRFQVNFPYLFFFLYKIRRILINPY